MEDTHWMTIEQWIPVNIFTIRMGTTHVQVIRTKVRVINVKPICIICIITRMEEIIPMLGVLTKVLEDTAVMNLSETDSFLIDC